MWFFLIFRIENSFDLKFKCYSYHVKPGVGWAIQKISKQIPGRSPFSWCRFSSWRTSCTCAACSRCTPFWSSPGPWSSCRWTAIRPWWKAAKSCRRPTYGGRRARSTCWSRGSWSAWGPVGVRDRRDRIPSWAVYATWTDVAAAHRRRRRCCKCPTDPTATCSTSNPCRIDCRGRHRQTHCPSLSTSCTWPPTTGHPHHTRAHAKRSESRSDPRAGTMQTRIRFNGKNFSRNTRRRVVGSNRIFVIGINYLYENNNNGHW